MIWRDPDTGKIAECVKDDGSNYIVGDTAFNPFCNCKECFDGGGIPDDLYLYGYDRCNLCPSASGEQFGIIHLTKTGSSTWTGSGATFRLIRDGCTPCKWRLDLTFNDGQVYSFCGGADAGAAPIFWDSLNAECPEICFYGWHVPDDCPTGFPINWCGEEFGGYLTSVTFVSDDNSGDCFCAYHVGDIGKLDGGELTVPGDEATFHVDSVDGGGHITAITLVSGGSYIHLPPRTATGTVPGHPHGDVHLTYSAILDSVLNCDNNSCTPPLFRLSTGDFATDTTLRFPSCLGNPDIFLPTILTFTMTVIRGGMPVVYTATLYLTNPCYATAEYAGELGPDLPADNCFGDPQNTKACVKLKLVPGGWEGHLLLHTTGGVLDDVLFFDYIGSPCFITYQPGCMTLPLSGVFPLNDGNCLADLLPCYPDLPDPCCTLEYPVASTFTPDDPSATIPWSIT
jgi:hypothetical protein